MDPLFRSIRFRALGALFALAVFSLAPLHAATPPRVGDTAPDFTLQTLDHHSVELSQLTAKRPVVLVVLRGWPGYQCPICTRQVHDFIRHKAGFDKAGVQVLMVYPGPAKQLQAHAEDFLHDKQWPSGFIFVIDPAFTFTNAYGLRWNKPRETSYPSTFIIDRSGTVRFAHISHTHGNRVKAVTALEALKALR